MRKMTIIFITMLMLLTTVFASDGMMAPSGILQKPDGTMVITDVYNHAIWSVKDGVYTRLAGRIATEGADGIPLGAYDDNKIDGLQTAFSTPWAIAPFANGYAITDSGNHVIRYLDNRGVTTLAGTGTPGMEDGKGILASFNRPTGIVADGEGGLYIADTDNHVIRYMDDNGSVTTYAGSVEGMADGTLTTAQFAEPTGLAYGNGVLYVADTSNHRICQIVDGQVTTLVGGTDGFADGLATSAMVSAPTGLAVGEDGIYIADSGNGAIRYLHDGSLTTLLVAEDTQLLPVNPRGVLLEEDTLWICDAFANCLFSVPTNPVWFADVAETAWYRDAVYYMAQKGYMNGNSDTQFAPEDSMTRSMFVQILFNLEGGVPVDALLPFEDAKDSWYTEAVRWASAEGIVQGTTDSTFSPQLTITREEMVTMLYRYTQWKGEDISATTDLTDFVDGKQISEFAVAPMKWALAKEVMQGYQGMVEPQAFALRAEGATMLMNFMER